ncbi:MAG: hypothetical protein KKH72_10695 [Alphaproteobacteria bacterium]|nr:hypothetical protein [Alphaproteobacteria bacterium]
MIKGIFNTAAALALVAGLTLPGAAQASEIRVTASYPQTSVIDFGQVLGQGGEIRITMPVPGQLAISVVRPGWQPAGPDDNVLVLNAMRVGGDLDDFGGPFGWRGIAITAPSVTISTVTSAEVPVASPEASCESTPETGE